MTFDPGEIDTAVVIEVEDAESAMFVALIQQALDERVPTVRYHVESCDPGEVDGTFIGMARQVMIRASAVMKARPLIERCAYIAPRVVKILGDDDEVLFRVECLLMAVYFRDGSFRRYFAPPNTDDLPKFVDATLESNLKVVRSEMVSPPLSPQCDQLARELCAAAADGYRDGVHCFNAGPNRMNS